MGVYYVITLYNIYILYNLLNVSAIILNYITEHKTSHTTFLSLQQIQLFITVGNREEMTAEIYYY